MPMSQVNTFLTRFFRLLFGRRDVLPDQARSRRQRNFVVEPLEERQLLSVTTLGQADELRESGYVAQNVSVDATDTTSASLAAALAESGNTAENLSSAENSPAVVDEQLTDDVGVSYSLGGAALTLENELPAATLNESPVQEINGMYLSLGDTLNDEMTSTSENAESQRIYGPLTYAEYLSTLPLDLYDPNGGGGMMLMSCGCCDPGCGCGGGSGCGCLYSGWDIYVGGNIAGAPGVVYACSNGSHSVSDTWITIQDGCTFTASIPVYANVYSMACYYNAGIKVDDPGKEYFAINTLTSGAGYQNGTFTWKKPDSVPNAEARHDFTFTYFVYFDANHDGKLDPNEEASIQTLGTLKVHIEYPPEFISDADIPVYNSSIPDCYVAKIKDIHANDPLAVNTTIFAEHERDITYCFSNGTQTNGFFQINATTGVITLNRNITEIEAIAAYTLPIKAYELAHPERYDTATVYVCWVDLDVDSDNDKVVSRSWDEDRIEESSPGKIFQASKTSAVEKREEMKLEIPSGSVWGTSTTVSLAFPDYFKVYKTGNTEIVSGQSYTLSQLGILNGGVLTLYVGATHASAATGVDKIIVTADPDGSGPLSSLKDTVVMTAFSIDIDARNSITLVDGSKAAPLMWNDDWDCKQTYGAGVTGHNEKEPIWDRNWTQSLTTADDDLMSTTINVLPVDLPGTFTLSYDTGVKLWTTNTKSALIANNTVYSSVGSIPKTLYTEGIDAGSNNIKLEYKYNNRTIGSDTLRADVIWLEESQGGVRKVINENNQNITFTIKGASLSDYGNLQWDLDGDGTYGSGVFEKMTTATATVKYSSAANAAGNINLPETVANRRKEYAVTVKLAGGYVLPLTQTTDHKLRVALGTYQGTDLPAQSTAGLHTMFTWSDTNPVAFDTLPAGDPHSGANRIFYDASLSSTTEAGAYRTPATPTSSIQILYVGVGAICWTNAYTQEILRAIVAHEVIHLEQYVAIRDNSTSLWKRLDDFHNHNMDAYRSMRETQAYNSYLVHPTLDWRFLLNTGKINSFATNFTSAATSYVVAPGDTPDVVTLKNEIKSMLQNIYENLPFIEMKRTGYQDSVRPPQ